MKIYLTALLAGLLVGAAPGVSFAGCATVCVLPDVCRITSQGPPTQYGCGLPSDRVMGGPRGPAGPRVNQGASSGVAQKGANSATTARTTGPKEQKQASIQSPRDVASGQATGKHQNKP
jgi:hypothetical protein